VDVTDAHRLLGPLPFDDVPSATVDGLLAELDRISVRRAYVMHTRTLFADPAGGNDVLFAQTRGRDRLCPVPVVILRVPEPHPPWSWPRRQVIRRQRAVASVWW
jgi:hypothetical protein